MVFKLLTSPTRPIQCMQEAMIRLIVSGVFVLGNYAYVSVYWNIRSGFGGGHWILDVSDPVNPVYAGSYARKFALQAAFLYWAITRMWRHGLWVFLLSTSPIRPIQYMLGTIIRLTDALGVFVLGNYAYIADADSGLLIIDVPTPQARYWQETMIRRALLRAYLFWEITSMWRTGLRFRFSALRPPELQKARNCRPISPSPKTTPILSTPRPRFSILCLRNLIVSIDIFDILGRKIETLAEGMKPAGNHQSDLGCRRSGVGDLFLQNKGWG